MLDIASEYKTIAQIEAETKTIRYCRSFDYARIMAFTKFLRELETVQGDRFRLLIAHPHLFENRKSNENGRAFGIGLWAAWASGETEYYMQMNENFFFDAFITRSWKLDATRKLHEYSFPMNNILYGSADFNAAPETITLLVKNFHKALSITDKRHTETYIKEIPSYDRKSKQTIYKD